MTGKHPYEGGPTFPLRHRLARLLFRAVWLLGCAWTPPVFAGWRRLVLRLFGARLGRRCDVRGSVSVWYPPNLEMADDTILADGVICYNVATISIGRRTIVSQRAVLCAASHDIRAPLFPLVAMPIAIGERCWIASEAFVGPGITIGTGAVLGARAAAFKDIEPFAVYGGNPAARIGERTVDAAGGGPDGAGCAADGSS